MTSRPLASSVFRLPPCLPTCFGRRPSAAYHAGHVRHHLPSPRGRGLVLSFDTDIVVERAEGLWVYDQAGNRWADFACVDRGDQPRTQPPDVTAAAIEQMGRVTHSGCVFRYESIVEVAERLVTSPQPASRCSASPTREPRRWRRRSSSPRKTSGRQAVIAFRGGFHGRTMGRSRTPRRTPIQGRLLPGARLGARLPFLIPTDGASTRAGHRPRPRRVAADVPPRDLTRTSRLLPDRAGPGGGAITRRPSASSRNSAESPTSKGSCWFSTRCRPVSAAPAVGRPPTLRNRPRHHRLGQGDRQRLPFPHMARRASGWSRGRWARTEPLSAATRWPVPPPLP